MNFIIVSIDSLRKDHLGCFGNDWIQTPNFDKFFEKSIIFDNFKPNAIPTIPFRRGMMLGRQVFPYRDHKVIPELTGILGWQPLGENERTFQQVLQEAGYITGFVTDVPHYYPPEMNFHRGFDSWQFIRGQECDPYITGSSVKDPRPFTYSELEGSHMQNLLEIHVRNIEDRLYEEDYFAPQVFRTAEKWLERNARYYENFYLYIDCFDPHEPWEPPRAYAELYDPGYEGREIIFPQNGYNEQLTPDEKKHIRALYAAEVTMVDRWFGHFMEKFELMGLEEDTAVLFLSDHGHPLGDHGIFKKLPPVLYWELLDIPMMLMMPKGFDKKMRINSFVQEPDIGPTILKLLGLEIPKSMDGKDFSSVITGDNKEIRKVAFGAYHTHAYIRDEKYHYFRDLAGQSEKYLFDLEKDPLMQVNIADEKPDIVTTMEEMLSNEIGGWVPPEIKTKTAYQKSYKQYRRREAGAWRDLYSYEAESPE